MSHIANDSTAQPLVGIKHSLLHVHSSAHTQFAHIQLTDTHSPTKANQSHFFHSQVYQSQDLALSNQVEHEVSELCDCIPKFQLTQPIFETPNCFGVSDILCHSIVILGSLILIFPLHVSRRYFGTASFFVIANLVLTPDTGSILNILFTDYLTWMITDRSVLIMTA